MQVEPITPPFKAPGTHLLKLKCVVMLSTSAPQFSLRRYNPDDELSKAFKFFDDDSSGKITVRNLRRIAREMGRAVQVEPMKFI